MATTTKQSSIPDLPASPFTTQDASWIKAGLELQFKSLERARSKYPSGSTLHTAMTVDLEAVRQLKEKF